MGRGRYGSMTIVRRPRCEHRWSKWQKAGIFDSTILRTCRKCGYVQRKHPPPGI